MDLEYIILALYGLLVTPSEDGVVTKGRLGRRAGSAGHCKPQIANMIIDLDDQLTQPNRW